MDRSIMEEVDDDRIWICLLHLCYVVVASLLCGSFFLFYFIVHQSFFSVTTSLPFLCLICVVEWFLHPCVVGSCSEEIVGLGLII
jgi:hypothetical protein